MNGQTKCYGGGEHPMCMPLVPAPMLFGAMMFGLLIGMMVGKKKAMMHGTGWGMHGMGSGMMHGHGGGSYGMGMGYGGWGQRKKMMGQMWGHHHHGEGAPCCCGQESSDMGEGGMGEGGMGETGMGGHGMTGGQDQSGM